MADEKSALSSLGGRVARPEITRELTGTRHCVYARSLIPLHTRAGIASFVIVRLSAERLTFIDSAKRILTGVCGRNGIFNASLPPPRARAPLPPTESR